MGMNTEGPGTLLNRRGFLQRRWFALGCRHYGIRCPDSLLGGTQLTTTPGAVHQPPSIRASPTNQGAVYVFNQFGQAV